MGGKKKGKKSKPRSAPEPKTRPELPLAAPAPVPRTRPELPLTAPAPEPRTRPKLPVAAPAPVQGPVIEPDVICKLKTVKFGGAARTIVYPPLPRHRSALLALVNALLLSGDLTAGIDAPNQVSIQHFLLRMKRYYGRLLKNHHKEASQNHIMDTIKHLSRPIDISVCFTRIDGIVSNSVDLEIFRNMGIHLYHLWMVDSQDAAVATAVGEAYYEIFRALYPYEPPVPIPNADQPVLDFLQGTGLTSFGLQELNNAMENDKTSVVFWNKTFHTIIKHNGGLYALHNDLRSFETDVLWKELNVEGDDRFCNSNFIPVVVPVMPATQVEVESQPAWEQLDKPDVPNVDARKILAALATSSQSQKHKCIRRNCPMHFHSVLNFDRHKQVHLKCHKAEMDSVNTIDIAKFWDQLSDEDSKELLSIKNAAAINSITGDIIYRILEKIGPEDDFYVIGNKLKCIINSSEKVSSKVLFAVLDEASEKTAFSTDIQRYPDYSIFGRGLPLLEEVSDTIACCSYLLERSLMEKWFEHKEDEASRNAAILLDEEAESSSSGIYGCTPHFNSGTNYNRHKNVQSCPKENVPLVWRSILERSWLSEEPHDDLSLMEKCFEHKEDEVSRNAAILLDEEAESSSSGIYGYTPHFNSGTNYNRHKHVQSSPKEGCVFTSYQNFLRELRSTLERRWLSVEPPDDFGRDVGVTDLPEVGAGVGAAQLDDYRPVHHGGVEGAEPWAAYVRHVLAPQSPVAVHLDGLVDVEGADRVLNIYDEPDPPLGFGHVGGYLSGVEGARHRSWICGTYFPHGRRESHTLAASSAVTGRESPPGNCPTVDASFDRER